MHKRIYSNVFAFVTALAFTVFPLHAQLADSPWPMFHRDPQHTGQSDYAGPSLPLLSWSYCIGNVSYPPYVAASPSLGADGRVYIGSVDERFYSLSSGGALSWSYLTGEWVEQSTPAIASDGTVYIGSDDYRLYAYTSSGGLFWSYCTGKWVLSSPVLGSDGRVYVGSYDNRLYAFNSGSALSWSYLTRGWVQSSPAIGTNGNVYVSSSNGSDGFLCAFIAGALSWSYDSAGASTTSSPAIGSDGMVFVGADDNRLYAFTSDGSLLGTALTGSDIFASPALGSDGKVYIGSKDGSFYVFNSVNSLSWSYLIGDEVDSSAVVGADGSVYVGSHANRLYAFSSSGSLYWSFVVGRDILSSPALGSDGELYFWTYDNILYCIGKGTAPTPQPTSTPTEAPAPTATPTPNYVELDVTNGPDFDPGRKVTLDWRTYEERYGYANTPCNVYLGVALSPVKEDQPVTVQEIVASGRLYLFDSKLRPVRYDPKKIVPTYKNVRFPNPKFDSHGTLNFSVPKGAAGRWAFAAAFIKKGGGFPAQPPVEVSNGFTLN